MEYETIITKKDKNILTVFLNRPKVHNAMNEKLMNELTSCFKKISSNEDIRTVILTGQGKSFCAGADLNWMKSMVNYSMDENIKDSQLLLDLYESIYSCPKPVIAKVNGHAFGGGLGLFAVCDIVYAQKGCKFAFSEVNLGIIPAVISSYIVKRIGISNMRRLFITGELFDSKYASKIGLVDFVEDEKDIDEKIKKYCDILQKSGPNAIKQIKKLADSYEKMNLHEYKEFTVKEISRLRVSKEGQEGINAFLEKRKSKWS